MKKSCSCRHLVQYANSRWGSVAARYRSWCRIAVRTTHRSSSATQASIGVRSARTTGPTTFAASASTVSHHGLVVISVRSVGRASGVSVFAWRASRSQAKYWNSRSGRAQHSSATRSGSAGAVRNGRASRRRSGLGRPRNSNWSRMYADIAAA